MPSISDGPGDPPARDDLPPVLSQFESQAPGNPGPLDRAATGDRDEAEGMGDVEDRLKLLGEQQDATRLVIKKIVDAQNENARSFDEFRASVQDFQAEVHRFREDFNRRLDLIEKVLKYVGGLLIASAFGAVATVAATGAGVVYLGQRIDKLEQNFDKFQQSVDKRFDRADENLRIQIEKLDERLSKRLDRADAILGELTKESGRVAVVLENQARQSDRIEAAIKSIGQPTGPPKPP